MIILYPFLVAASLLVTLFACLFVNWWAPVFADSNGNLPRWLSWFQTFDASLDAGWKDGYFACNDDPHGFELFWLRVRWMYRNPAYGFDMFAFGAPWSRLGWRCLTYRKDGAGIVFFAIGPWLAFNVYVESRFGQLKIGWKAWNHWDGTSFNEPAWAGLPKVPLCFTINPFKRFKA